MSVNLFISAQVLGAYSNNASDEATVASVVKPTHFELTTFLREGLDLLVFSGFIFSSAVCHALTRAPLIVTLLGFKARLQITVFDPFQDNARINNSVSNQASSWVAAWAVLAGCGLLANRCGAE